jgi:hypothetical protein
MPGRLPPVVLPSGGREQDNAATTQVVIQQLFGRDRTGPHTRKRPCPTPKVDAACCRFTDLVPSMPVRSLPKVLSDSLPHYIARD